MPKSGAVLNGEHIRRLPFSHFVKKGEYRQMTLFMSSHKTLGPTLFHPLDGTNPFMGEKFTPYKGTEQTV
jgi:hypothetical protein